MRLYTGSGAERAHECPASVALSQAPNTSEASIKGSDNHEKTEIGLVTGEIEKLPEVVRSFMAAGVTADAEVSYMLNVETRAVRLLGRRLNREYGPVAKYEIPLTIDAVFRGPGGVVVVDWKSHERVTPADRNIQVRAGCLAVLTHDEVMQLTGAIGYLDNADIDRTPFDAFAAEALWDELKRDYDIVLEAIDAHAMGAKVDLHSGPWCKYCPAFSFCAAQTRLALAMLGELEEVDSVVADLSDEQAGVAWAKLKAVLNVAGRIETALKGRAQRSPIPLPNGKRLALVEVAGRRGVDAKKVEELLASYGHEVPFKNGAPYTQVKEIGRRAKAPASSPELPPAQESGVDISAAVQ